ncbi:hypothetical protein HPB52_003445 [Rhipicephalus sanguineus]|uniref:Reverse transcriptase domain-containing protein n=1 Tax=Rhipicephalus sanguineus TaxID=34632 RepID=A0A9D4QKD9_RHISA|nr:hypothetical protein HPB52_003445 [Rhipicephalus sanguineus]
MTDGFEPSSALIKAGLLLHWLWPIAGGSGEVTLNTCRPRGPSSPCFPKQCRGGVNRPGSGHVATACARKAWKSSFGVVHRRAQPPWMEPALVCPSFLFPPFGECTDRWSDRPAACRCLVARLVAVHRYGVYCRRTGSVPLGTLGPPKTNVEQPCPLPPPQLSPPPRRLPCRRHRRRRSGSMPRLRSTAAPLRRLPADTIHIIGRPKSLVELTKLQPWYLYTALLQTACLQDLTPAPRDMVRIHPVNSTFKISVADSPRAQAYLRITSLTVSSNTFTVKLYAPPPDDAHGILYHAFDDFTDQAILEDLQASNPTLSVVGGRRMGKSPHILVTLMDPKLPRWISCHGVQLRLLPLRNKVEACYNCRSTGHQTEEWFHRCGAAHRTSPEGSPPICNPRCIVCNGNHSTFSSNCKHRYVQRTPHQKAPVPDTHPSTRQEAARGSSPAPPPKSVTACPPLVPAVPKPAYQTMRSTWPRDAPGSPSEPQVVAVQQENACLRLQLSAQSAQIAALKTQLDCLQAKLHALEEKLESAIPTPSSLSSPIDSDMDVQVTIKTALVDPEKRLNSRFNSVHQLLTAQHEVLNSLHTDFAAYPPATQETHADVSLSGYVVYNQANHHPLPHPVTAVLTQRTLVVNRADPPFPAIHHVFLEILPQRREHPSLVILNVYNPPRATEDASLLALLLASPLLILINFHAKHSDWGYSKADGPGRRLWQLANDLKLSPLIYPTQPTRIGNSVCPDTTPDLSFSRSVRDERWSNTHQSLGSDHYVLTIQVVTSPSRPRPYAARYTDSDAFRERRLHSAAFNIEDLSTWTNQLLADLDAVTASIPTTEDHPATDFRLAHLWAARTGVRNRWHKQRPNRRLRRHIAHLDRTIEQHTTALARQRWEQLSSWLSGQLGCKISWHLLRHLFDPASANSVSRQQLQRVVWANPGDTPSLMAELSDKYLQLLPPGTPPPLLASYSGAPDQDLDADITEAEVYAAVQKLRTTSAPCPDPIPNKLLRNLDTPSVVALTSFLNECWRSGNLPQSWKHPRVAFILKPGKEPAIENLRPISPTSRVGKFLEHDLLDQATFSDTKALLSLDMQKAFDHVSHSAILAELAALNPGTRTYNYIRSLLTGCKAEIIIGDLPATTYELGPRGTPQGAVLSFFLLNLVLRSLPDTLDRTPGLKHTLYALDIALWVTSGCDGHIEQTLQRTTHVVTSHVDAAGLTCSAAKSALLLMRPLDRRRYKTPHPPSRFMPTQLPSPSFRISAQAIALGAADCTYARPCPCAAEGMRKHDLLRFVVSRLTYGLPYKRLLRSERDKIVVLMRRAYKTALGLQSNASTDPLRLGVHNTFDELIHAHRSAEVQGLYRSPTGRRIISSIGHDTSSHPPDLVSLPHAVRAAAF